MEEETVFTQIIERKKPAEIIYEDEDYAVLVEKGASVRLEGISFRHVGDMWADVVVVENGSIKIRECSFEGAQT